MARVALLNVEDLPEDSRWLLERNSRGPDGLFNIYRSIAHQPDGLRQFMRLGSYLLTRSSLDPRLREIAILRTGAANRCRYEVAHHVGIARAAGLTTDEVKAAVRGEETAFSDAEAAILAFAGELTRESDVSDATFAAVRAHLGEAGVVDLVLTVGYYNLVSRLLNSLRVDLEPPFAQAFAELGVEW